MTKEQAIHSWVSQLSAIPQNWVQKLFELEGQSPRLPMWGTMWILDEPHDAETLLDLAHYVEPCEVHEDYNNFCDACNDYDEEMEGELCIPGTPVYIYKLDGETIIGVHGAGWDFYDGVWDKLYDLLGLKWHDDEPENN